MGRGGAGRGEGREQLRSGTRRATLRERVAREVGRGWLGTRGTAGRGGEGRLVVTVGSAYSFVQSLLRDTPGGKTWGTAR